MSQNNMICYITLTDLNNDPIEMNPSFIAMMRRINDNEIPYTQLTMAIHVSHSIYGPSNVLNVMQTPEEIAHLQMTSIAKTMETFMESAQTFLFDEN